MIVLKLDGPEGSGKTILLNHLLRELAPLDLRVRDPHSIEIYSGPEELLKLNPLRDTFAAAALSGAMANSKFQEAMFSVASANDVTAYLAAAPAPEAYQKRVAAWTLECFGAEITADKVERADRFIEEALELAQATGWPADRAHALVDYVFGRPTGEIGQEVGGVMVTLAALCNVFDIDIDAEARREVDRITQPEIVLKIRAKQAAKPTGSALPIAAPTPPPAQVTDEMVERAVATWRDHEFDGTLEHPRMALALSAALQPDQSK